MGEKIQEKINCVFLKDVPGVNESMRRQTMWKVEKRARWLHRRDGWQLRRVSLMPLVSRSGLQLVLTVNLTRGPAIRRETIMCTRCT